MVVVWDGCLKGKDKEAIRRTLSLPGAGLSVVAHKGPQEGSPFCPVYLPGPAMLAEDPVDKAL